MAKTYILNPVIDLNLCYLWQYDKAKKVSVLLKAKQDFYNENVTSFWEDWFNNIFNIQTANTFGLNLWGAILGVKRPSYEENNQTILFSDEQYRTLIIGRMMLMNSNGSVSDINNYLNYLFPGKPVFVSDFQNMSISLVFYYNPTPEEMAIIQSDGFLPKPVGVQVNYAIVTPEEVFGFVGQDLSNFDNGSFFA